MNICILVKSTLSHQIGGMEVHAQALGESAVKSGHSVNVISTQNPKGIEYEEKDGVIFHYLKKARSARYSKSWWKESANKIIELHNKNKFDIIWAESFSGYYYAWKTKSLINVPIICIMQGGGIIGVIKSGWNSITSFKEFFIFFGKYLPESILVVSSLFWKTLHYSDAIAAVSDESSKAIQREFFIKPEKIFVVYNSIDVDIFKPDASKRISIRKRYSLSEKTRIILMAGVVHKQKGMHIGLKAFCQIKKEIPDCKMMIVGDGPQSEFLKKLAKKLNIENDVIFCGLIPNEETSHYYNAADIFLNPTVRVEGLPIVTIEAMACGLPVVVTRIGGTQSTIQEGESGFFVKPKDLKSLSRKTIEILKDPVLSKRMGEFARENAVRKFSKEKMTADYLNISQRLID